MWHKLFGCMFGKKKPHEQTFIVCKWGDWDTDEIKDEDSRLLLL